LDFHVAHDLFQAAGVALRNGPGAAALVAHRWAAGVRVDVRRVEPHRVP